VIYAANKGGHGEIFIKKTTAARVLDVAKCLFKILNKKEKINFIGIRHGEKIHETLVSQNEMLHVTSNRDFYKIPLDNRNLNYDNYFSKGKKNQSSFHAYTSNNANILNMENLEKILKNIVTEILKQ
jgi:UDP-glucose 4-epimerase